jgi:hypothetical protein
VPVDGGDPESLKTFAYEISDRPGFRLFIGVPEGQTRPALWCEMQGHAPAILARFYGPSHAQITVNFLDTMIDQINRITTYLMERDNDKDEGSTPT